MTRKTVDNSAQQSQPHEDHFLGQWACSLSVIIFMIAFGLSGQLLPRFVANQCTSEQGMCTPGDCTCPFPLLKRDLVTQDAQACSQCVEEFCPAVIEGDSTCSTTACECEDPTWPRTNAGSSEKPCMQCVHPHLDVTLRREDGSGCLTLGESTACTVFRYNGAVMLQKISNKSSCLTWSNGDWQLAECQGTPDSSSKFTRRGGRDEASAKGTFCTSRGKQCLHINEYMCTTDPSQCSTEQCRCEDPSHLRKEMQTVNRTTCYLCTPSLPDCPLSSAGCSSEPCECKPGFVKARSRSDEHCFSCQPSMAQSVTGLSSVLTFLSAGATFLLCVGLGVVVGCAIRRFIVGDPAPARRKRRLGSQTRTWSENLALYLEEAMQAVSTRIGGWKPLKKVSWAVKKVVSFLDACDAALDPVYVVLEAGLDKVQHTMNANIDRAKKLLGEAESSKGAKGKKDREGRDSDGRQGHKDVLAAKEQFLARAQNDKVGGKEAGQSDQNLSWDPINMNLGNEEWMNYVVPSLSAQRQSARHSRSDAPTSAVQRLRQRREAKAQAAVEQAPAPAASATEVEVDESWIDAIEQKEAKEREAKEKAAAQRRERKQAAKARRAKAQAGVSQDADTEEAEDVAGSKLPGNKQQQDLLFSEAIHGMFLLATSDARQEVVQQELEKGQDDSGDSETPEEEKVIFPSSSSKVPREVSGEEPGDMAEGEDGWTKSVSSRSRGGKRRGQEPNLVGSDSGQMPSEQEPAAEPDPQQDPEDLPETPDVAGEVPDAPELSKRQRQRLRQRQPKVGKPAKAETTSPAVSAAVTPPVPPSSEMRRSDSKEAKADQGPTAAAAPKASPEPVETEAAECDDEPEELEEESGKEEPKALVRNFADIVAGRPARSQEEIEAAAAAAFSSFKADAPDFVPMSMSTQFQAMSASSYAMVMDPVMPTKKARRRRGRKEAEESQSLPLTTVVIGDISDEHDAQSFRLQLDGWGLAYNFFYMPPEKQEEYGHCAVVNFVDPGFVMMCQQLFQQAGEATVTFFPVQGLENNVAYWTSFGVAEDLINGPMVFPAAAAQWSADPNAMLNSKFSPQIKEQFHKTKLCVFNKKQKCSMGAQCPFAHSEEELQKAPDLTKTKLCYNFFRRKCNDANCKFAHGYGELRATDTVFKTELCRWWANGSCKAGASCRYAHGVEELRSNPNFTGMFGADFDLSEANDFAFGFGLYPYSLEEDMQMAEMAEDPDANVVEDGLQFALQERSPTRSDEEMSEALTSVAGAGVSRLQRQQTAPPGVTVSQDDDIILRIKGTFMEAVRIDEELPQVSMRRSWSDGDLAQLCEALDSDSD